MITDYITPELLSAIITAAIAIISAFGSLIVVAITTRKKKLELEAEKIQLEQDNIKLQQAIVDNAFIICPSCGQKIKLKDADIKTEGGLNK